MPNGSLTIASNFSGETGYVIAVLVKSTAPLTEITRVVYSAPHSQREELFENLQPVWHLIRFWRSADGVSLDEEILTLAGNARSGAVYPVERYEYVVGRGDGETGVWADPEQDDIGIRDTRLLGAMYWVEERGTGSLLTSEITDRSDEGGGFDFTQEGKVMNDEGVYIVTAIHRVDITADSEDPGSIVSEGIYILEDDQDYDAALMSGKILVADFVTTVGVLNMPNLALIPNGRFTLQTHGGAQRNLTLQLDAGDTVKFRGQDVNKIVLGQGEDLEIIIDENSLYVGRYNTNHARIGERIFADKELLNTLIRDGGSRALADYPRVDEYLDSLPAGAVVNETTWQTSSTSDGETIYPNKGKWMREGLNFRPPDDRAKYMRGLDITSGTPAAGAFKQRQMIGHSHFIASGGDGAGDYLSRSHGAGGNSSYEFNSSGTVPVQYKTSSVGGSTQEVNAVILYPLICI